jgi:tRNA dimethylallyltransferase
VAVLGPTASGKSAVAERLAEEHRAVLLSVDSMQVYRGMDIGTAKPDRDTRSRLTYHMIDLADPRDDYTVAEFQKIGTGHLAELEAEGKTAIIVGGSGLHFGALVDPLEFPPTSAELRAELGAMPTEDLVGELLTADRRAADHVDLANPRRVVRAVEILRLTGTTPSERAAGAAAAAVRSYTPRRPLGAIGLDPGGDIAARVERRFDRMLAEGFVEEVEALADRLGVTASQAVGYRELLGVIRGETDLATARDAAIGATRALARRQRTFFRKDPRIRWLVWDHDPDRRFEAAGAAIEASAKEASAKEASAKEAPTWSS